MKPANETKPFEIKFDAGPHPKGQIGFIAVANADLTEADMFRMKPEGVGVHFTRVRMPEKCTISSLAAMEAALDDALATLMPARTDLDVVCYNCTAGSFVIGEEAITTKLARHGSGVKATTLLTGVVQALKALGVRRLAMGTAYTEDINRLESDYFAAQGIEVVSLRGLDLMTDMQMNRVSLNSLTDFALAVDRPDADAVFMSCGALRSVEVIERVERLTGKPFIYSNQASMWHCMRLAGIADRIPGFGRLLRQH